MTEDEKGRPDRGGPQLSTYSQFTNTPARSAVLEAALRYAAAGIAVFPARIRVRGDGKKDVSPISAWPKASTIDPDTIRAWFTGPWQDAALCIDCGKSGIVGVDQDVSDGKTGPQNWAELEHVPTVRVKTPSGGFHDYYRADPQHPITVDNRGAVADGVDIRGMGGFLFAPPSIDPRGGSWQWENGEPNWADLPMVPEVVIKRVETAHADKRVKVPAIAALSSTPALSQLFASPSDLRGQSGAGDKKLSAASALLSSRLDDFRALTEEGSGRSHILATDLGILAGHGVGVFWDYEGALQALLDACAENGFSAAHGEAYARQQAERGLEYGMRELWNPIPEDAEPAEESAPAVSSWTPIDLTPVLTGERKKVLPELGRRQDGVRLLYRGKEHSVASEPECGKTWWVLLQVMDILNEGGRVVYIDFEDDEDTIIGRLLDLGCAPSHLSPETFRYVRPESKPAAGELTALYTFPEGAADLVVFDGVTESMGVLGLETNSNDAITVWRKTLVRPALNLKCATLSTDHVVKNKEARGRFALGGGHKLAGLTGVMYLMRQVKPFGQGMKGRSEILVSKDRNGGVRCHGRPDEEDPRLTFLGDLVGDSTGEAMRWTFYAPRKDEAETPDDGVVRPPHTMREVVKKVQAYLVRAPGSSQEQVAVNVGGRKVTVKDALTWMQTNGLVRVEQGPRNAKLHHLVNVFAAVEGPAREQGGG